MGCHRPKLGHSLLFAVKAKPAAVRHTCLGSIHLCLPSFLDWDRYVCRIRSSASDTLSLKRRARLDVPDRVPLDLRKWQMR